MACGAGYRRSYVRCPNFSSENVTAVSIHAIGVMACGIDNDHVFICAKGCYLADKQPAERTPEPFPLLPGQAFQSPPVKHFWR
jgi:hypothetical protein